MNTPQVSSSVGGRGPSGVRPTRNPSGGDASSHTGDSIPNRRGRESNTFAAPPGRWGPSGGGLGAAWRKYSTPKSNWSWHLRIPSMARSSATGYQGEGASSGVLSAERCGNGTNFGKE